MNHETFQDPKAGGQLPKTSSPGYNILAMSFGLVLLGNIGIKVRKAIKLLHVGLAPEVNSYWRQALFLHESTQ